MLFNQGDRGEIVYIVESGVVELYRIRDDQSEERLTDIEPGGYFGELAPMFGLRRSASARAGAQPTVLTGLGLRDFRGRMGWTATAGAAELDTPA